MLALLFSLTAFAATAPAVKFYQNNPVTMITYADEAACNADQGRWDGENCQFDAWDTVTISGSQGAFELNVSTITTNAHTCDFDAPAVQTAPGVLVATSGNCSLQASYLDDNNVTVQMLSSYDDCQDFCGANASLEVTRATRVQ
ncbi:MAG: hypothetical protein ACXWSD_07705 [Bdellovibrionota bacterium]